MRVIFKRPFNAGPNNPNFNKSFFEAGEESSVSAAVKSSLIANGFVVDEDDQDDNEVVEVVETKVPATKRKTKSIK